MIKTSVPQTQPPGDGWRKWQWSRPNCPVFELWREEWQEVKVADMSNIHPQMNCWNLWWRPAYEGGETVH